MLLIFLSASILFLLSGYGVIFPVVVRDVFGQGQLYSYVDQLGIGLKSNAIDLDISGEAFIGYNGNNVYLQLTIHATTFYVYAGDYPIFSLGITPMETTTTARTNFSLHTALQVLNTTQINRLIHEAVLGKNPNVVIQSHMGISVFGVNTLQQTFVEKSLLPANKNISAIAQQIVDGTYTGAPRPVDPTQKNSPKTVFPKLQLPDIQKMALYNATNEFGIDIQYQWQNNFVTLLIKESHIPISLNNQTIGNFVLRNLNLYQGNVNGNVRLGFQFNNLTETNLAISTAIYKLINTLSINVGVAGPFLVTGLEPMTWLENSTKSLFLSVHLDIPTLVQKLPLLNTKFAVAIKSVQQTLVFQMRFPIPNSIGNIMANTTNALQSVNVGITFSYIKELIEMNISNFGIVNNVVQMEASLKFFNEPLLFSQLISVLSKSGQTTTNDKMQIKLNPIQGFDVEIDPSTLNMPTILNFISQLFLKRLINVQQIIGLKL